MKSIHCLLISLYHIVRNKMLLYYSLLLSSILKKQVELFISSLRRLLESQERHNSQSNLAAKRDWLCSRAIPVHHLIFFDFVRFSLTYYNIYLKDRKFHRKMKTLLKFCLKPPFILWGLLFDSGRPFIITYTTHILGQ